MKCGLYTFYKYKENNYEKDDDAGRYDGGYNYSKRSV